MRAHTLPTADSNCIWKINNLKNPNNQSLTEEREQTINKKAIPHFLNVAENLSDKEWAKNKINHPSLLQN